MRASTLLPNLVLSNEHLFKLVEGGRKGQGMTFKGMTFEGMTFEAMTFEGMTFKGMSLKGMTFKGMTFKGMTFKGMTLKGMIADNLEEEAIALGDLCKSALKISCCVR